MQFLKWFLLFTIIFSFQVFSSSNSLAKPTLVFSNSCENHILTGFANLASSAQGQTIYVACERSEGHVNVYEYTVTSPTGNPDDLVAQFSGSLPSDHPLRTELDVAAAQTLLANNVINSYVATGIEIPNDYIFSSSWALMMDRQYVGAIIADSFQPDGELFLALDKREQQMEKIFASFNVVKSVDSSRINMKRTINVEFPDGTSAKFLVHIDRDLTKVKGKYSIRLEFLEAKDRSGRIISKNGVFFLTTFDGLLLDADSVGDMSNFIDYMELLDVKIVYVNPQVDPDLKGTLGKVCKPVRNPNTNKRELKCTNG